MNAAPRLVVFAGPNGAGKSTLAQRLVGGRMEIVNPDVIAAQIAPDRAGDPGVVLQAGRLAVERRKVLLAEGKGFGIETTLTGNSELRMMAEARDRGFKVDLVFVGLNSKEQSAGRVATRVATGGHDVPVEDIERRYDRSMKQLPEAMGLADRVLLADNSGSKHRLIMLRDNQNTRLISRNVPPWAKAALPAEMFKVTSKGRGMEI